MTKQLRGDIYKRCHWKKKDLPLYFLEPNLTIHWSKANKNNIWECQLKTTIQAHKTYTRDIVETKNLHC